MQRFHFIVHVIASWAILMLLGCSGGGGGGNTTQPPAAPSISSFVVSPSTVTQGQTALLSSVFSNGTGIITPGNLSTTSGQAITVSPSSTTTYTLTVTNGAAASVTRTVNLTVNPAPTITNFTANPSTIIQGQTAYLSATYSNGTGFIDNSVGVVTSDLPVSIIVPTTTTYSLTVTNSSGVSATRTTTLTVLPPPIQVALDKDAIGLTATGTHRFIASISGTSENAVSWSVKEGSSGGTVQPDGTGSAVYTAPMGEGLFHVRATSIAHPEIFAEAAITVSQDASVVVANCTRVVDDGLAAQISSISPDGINVTFVSSDTRIRDYLPGDIMIAGVTPKTPNGMLRRIVSKSINGNTVAFLTMTATLEDVFSGGIVRLNQAPASASLKIGYSKNGIENNDSNQQTIFIDSKYEFGTQIPVKFQQGDFTLNNTFSLDQFIPDPENVFDWHLIDTTHIRFGLKSQFTWKTSVTLAKEYHFSDSGPLGPVIPVLSGSFTFLVPPGIPITVNANFQFEYNINMDVNASLEISDSHIYKITAGIDYLSNREPKYILYKTFDHTEQPSTPSLVAEGHLHAGIGPNFQFGVEGVYFFHLMPQIFFEGHFTPLSDPCGEIDWGVDLTAGVGLRFLGKKWIEDHNFEPINIYKNTIKTWPGPLGGSINISPGNASLSVGATRKFSAQVATLWPCDQTVKWSVSAGGGSVVEDGTYTAPATPGTYTVKATSSAFSNLVGTAVVTVTSTPVIGVSISPSIVSLQTGQSQQFNATVTETTNRNVTWSIVEGPTGGTVSGTGFYTAPNVPGTYHVKATSLADPTKSDEATVTVATPTARPDLQVVNGAVTPASVATGGAVTATWTITNAGTGTAGASTTVVRVNQSSTSAAGTNAFTYSVPSLAANGTFAQSASITAPSTAGTYYVWVITDNTNSAGQSASAAANDIVRIGSFVKN